MTNMVVDSSYLEAILNTTNKNHEVALDIAQKIKKHDSLYVPYPVYIETLNSIHVANNETKSSIVYIIGNTTKILNINKTTYNKAIENFCKEDNNLNFTDYICIEFMKEKGIPNILSFKKEFDKIDNITRLKKSDFHYQNVY